MSKEKEFRDEFEKIAKEVKTKKDLISLLEKIETYKHDYGTIVHGCYAAMIGAFNYLNKQDCGGITGFQARCLAHELIQKFMMVKPPYKILDYNKMLYPQHRDNFEKTIRKDVFESLKEKANENLLEYEKDKLAHPSVVAHWRSIASGDVPFGYQIKEDI